jgi:diketogulonate reductase-like aldo/keto reductase
MVGAAIKKSGIPRSEIFITTKLWNNSHNPKDVEPALDASLKDLGTDYVDLYLMHWPSAFKSGSNVFPKDKDGKVETDDISYLDTWKAMEKLVKTGKTKAVGISNFSKAEVETLLNEGSIVPAAHQIECHPWLQQNEFTEWLKSKGIHVQQYSPFGNQNEIYESGKKMGKLMVSPFLYLVLGEMAVSIY